MPGVSPERFAEVYPELFHMAEHGSWPSIETHGLLCTERLCDLFELTPDQRAEILSRRRPDSLELNHNEHGTVVVRDQKVLHESKLQKSLLDEMTLEEWFRMLNSQVFFWPTARRLGTFMNAAEYRRARKTVLTIRTLDLLSRYRASTVLSHMNSGSTAPIAHPRGRNTFLPLAQFPFEERRSKYGAANAVAEVAIPGGVPDIVEFVVRVEEVDGQGGARVIWCA